MNILEILKFTLPALLVFLTAYILIDKQLKNEERKRTFYLKKDNLSTITPIRLRAYERLMLLLERTTPNTLILGVSIPGMKNRELHSALLESIRHEFSHNISQQIYVSDELWKYIKNAQESLLKLVNTCAAKCQPDDSATQLAEQIIQVYSSNNETPSELAISTLKNEVRFIFQ